MQNHRIFDRSRCSDGSSSQCVFCGPENSVLQLIVTCHLESSLVSFLQVGVSVALGILPRFLHILTRGFLQDQACIPCGGCHTAGGNHCCSRLTKGTRFRGLGADVDNSPGAAAEITHKG
jgi:hypothetical protein